MSDAIDYARTAQTLAQYFARQEAAEGNRWAASGKAAAGEWLRLISQGECPAEDLARLDDLMLEGSAEYGTAWIELRRVYQQWRGKGRSS